MAKKLLKLTADNYYGQQANIDYYSVSQIKSFLDCPSKAVAEIDGSYQHECNNAMLIGSYVDSFFSGEFDLFKDTHPEIFNSRTGELKADFRIANEVIDKFSNDPVASAIIVKGKTQKIVTGKIAGLPFKAKLDFWLNKSSVRQLAKKNPGLSDWLFSDGAIVDMKVMRDFDPIYVEGQGKLNFIEAWHYDLQLAVYQELMFQRTRRRVPCYILACTREKCPDIGLFEVSQETMNQRLKELIDILPEINAIKTGQKAANGCGHCEVCRKNKVITGPVSLEVL